jgi:hypothetical protein
LSWSMNTFMEVSPRWLSSVVELVVESVVATR